MFGIKKHNNGIAYIKEVENRDLLWISYDEQIPSRHQKTVFSLRINEHGHIEVDENKQQTPEPSTIYVHLPIAKDYNAGQLPYWPHYIDIEPGQRFTYLNWLRNIDNPIDVGYVFLYYYGLERHLLIGDFEKAFNQIIRLRNIHKNGSFQGYSEQALIHSCIMRDRLDLLVDLHEKTEVSGFSNAQFLLAYNLKMDLSVKNLLEVFYRAFNLSRKAIRENYNLMEECTTEVVCDKCGQDGFPVKDYDISKTKAIEEIRFANYSFPKEVQYVEITDFYQCKPLMNDVEHIFKLSYEKYKGRKAFERKKLNSNKSDKAIKQTKPKRDLNRYKELLSDKQKKADEINMAYRTADYERWQRNDSVVGIEIRLSNNHTLNGKPFTDICDELAGKYPKTFKFTGWHPQCRCFAIPVMKTQEELKEDYRKIENGEETDNESVNKVKDVPENIINYVEKHPECKLESWYLDNIKIFK